jgi:putative addiction module component (TIGR02574 family)
MVRPTDALASQLLVLPLHERARLVELLLASLDAEQSAAPAESVEAAWRAEAMRRLDDLRTGAVTGIPADQVFATLRGTITGA